MAVRSHPSGAEETRITCSPMKEDEFQILEGNAVDMHHVHGAIYTEEDKRRGAPADTFPEALIVAMASDENIYDATQEFKNYAI